MIRIREQREDGKYRVEINNLVEAANIEALPLNESSQNLTVEGNKVKCIAAYRVPISRPGEENLNERVYEEELWDRVIREQKEQWSGAFGLCDHPEDGGSVKDAFCVWDNLQKAEKGGRKLIMADMYLFGQWGQHAEEAIQAGGRLGFSSVGFGDFLEDEKTIDPDSYVLERPADWVMDPSYEVFGGREDRIGTGEMVKSSESAEASDTTVSEGADTSEPLFTFSTRRQRVREGKQPMSLEERDFRRKINAAIEEAEQRPSVEARLQDFEDIVTYFDGVEYGADLKEKVEQRIDELEKEISDLITKGAQYDEATQTKEQLAQSLNETKQELEQVKESEEKLRREYDSAIETLRSVKEYANTLRRIHRVLKAKTNSMVAPSDYKETLAYAEDLEKTVEQLKEEKSSLESKVQEYEETINGIEQRNREQSETRRKQAERNQYLAKRREEFEKKRQEERRILEEEHEREVGLDFSNNSEVQAYYDDLVEENPEVAVLKDQILSCKTLIEAQMTYLRYRDVIEEDASVRPYIAEAGEGETDPIFDPNADRHGLRESVLTDGSQKPNAASSRFEDDGEEDIFS